MYLCFLKDIRFRISHTSWLAKYRTLMQFQIRWCFFVFFYWKTNDDFNNASVHCKTPAPAKQKSLLMLWWRKSRVVCCCIDVGMTTMASKWRFTFGDHRSIKKKKIIKCLEILLSSCLLITNVLSWGYIQQDLNTIGHCSFMFSRNMMQVRSYVNRLNQIFKKYSS